MNLTEVKGDLFSYIADASVKHPRFIGHGVNMMGFMGAGVAYAVQKRWPLVDEEYRTKCYASTPKDLKGKAQLCWATPHVGVFNMFTQQDGGADARTPWVLASIADVARQLLLREVPVELAIPRVGCGIGGLKWADVKPQIEKLPLAIDLYVYSL